jgi:DNA-binding transcriptional LysR family regulator
MDRTYYKGIQLEQIRSFCRVARLGSFAAAAAELDLSSPTVWRQVRALERESGAALLVRRGRAVQLTREGHIALELLEPHLSGIDSVRDLLQTQIASLPRTLTIASTSLLLNDFLTGAVRRYMEVEPAVRLSLLGEPSDTSLRRVVANEADVGVATYLPDEPRDPQLVYEDLDRLPWLLATAAGNPLSRKRSLRLGDLVEYPWIMPAVETQPRRHLENVLHRERLRDRVRIVMESRTFGLTETYVRLGLGITVWYGRDLKHPPAGLWMRPVTQWFGSMPVAVVMRKGKHPPPHVTTFMHIVRQTLGQGGRDGKPVR